MDQKRNDEVHEVYLIPELCVMTGLSDSNRADFNLMKEID